MKRPSLKFDKDAILGFLLNHGEKFVVGLIGQGHQHAEFSRVLHGARVGSCDDQIAHTGRRLRKRVRREGCMRRMSQR
jgi:hypothetical protein